MTVKYCATLNMSEYKSKVYKDTTQENFLISYATKFKIPRAQLEQEYNRKLYLVGDNGSFAYFNHNYAFNELPAIYEILDWYEYMQFDVAPAFDFISKNDLTMRYAAMYLDYYKRHHYTFKLGAIIQYENDFTIENTMKQYYDMGYDFMFLVSALKTEKAKLNTVRNRIERVIKLGNEYNVKLHILKLGIKELINYINAIDVNNVIQSCDSSGITRMAINNTIKETNNNYKTAYEKAHARFNAKLIENAKQKRLW